MTEVRPAFRRVHTKRARDVLVDHLVNAPRGAQDVHAKRACDLGIHQRPRVRRVERHFAAEERRRVEKAEQQVGIGQSRMHATLAVADRARTRAGAARPDAQCATLVDIGQAAAARADLDHVDHRNLDRQAAAFLELVHSRHFQLVALLRRAVMDEAALGRRAAHVERQHVELAERASMRGGHQRARRRAGLEQPDGEAPRDIGSEAAAA